MGGGKAVGTMINIYYRNRKCFFVYILIIVGGGTSCHCNYVKYKVQFVGLILSLCVGLWG